MTTSPSDLAGLRAAIDGLTLLADLAHLATDAMPVVSRHNAAAFAADVRLALDHIASLSRQNAGLEETVAHVRESLSDQAAARADPTMPRLTSTVLETLKTEAEANYACAMTRDDRVAAHGLSLLCEWQERAALASEENAALIATMGEGEKA